MCNSTNENIKHVFWERNLFKIGKSLFLNVPADYAKFLGLRKGDIAQIAADGQEDLVIRFKKEEREDG